MKICIDGGMGLISSEKGGIYYLLPQFLSALYKIAPENKYLIYGYFLKNYFKRVKFIKKLLSPYKFSYIFFPIPSRVVKIIESFHFPLIETLLKKEKISIYHGFCAGYLPYFKKTKTVYTVHDLSFEIMPDFYKDKWYENVKDAAIRADIIITPSFSTKNDLVNIYKIPENKIFVIYHGVNKEIFYPREREEIKQVLKEFFLCEKYILTVATSIKRKNIPFLLDVYKILKEKKIEEKLVIIAGTNSLKKEILKLAEEEKIKEEDLICLAEVPLEKMPFFYSGAEIFVFPSLYEGFGLPVLEAMACGVPVIMSNLSSLPEIGGNSCLYFNPYEKEEMVNIIEKVLMNENLKKELKKKSLERAKNFDWEKTAIETLKIYKILVQ